MVTPAYSSLAVVAPYARVTNSTRTASASDWRIPMTRLGLMTVGAYGLIVYSFAAFITPIRDDTGRSNSHLSAAFSLSALLSGFGAVTTGHLLDRVGLRSVTAAALTAGSALLWLASSLTTAW